MANHDPIQDLELLADEKFLTLEADFLSNFAQPWEPVYEGQRVVQSDDVKYFTGEPMPLSYSGTNSISPTNVTPNVLLPDYMQSADSQPIYFHPGVSHSSNGSDVAPSVASFMLNEEDPGSVRPPKSRDRARHREVEQKYRNRINSKMDELCALLTPDGKPQMQKWTALDNAIKLIKYLRRQNDFLRNESANLRAQVYTLQCALNRSMGVDFVPNTAYPPEQPWPNTNTNNVKMSGSVCSVSPGPSPSSASDDIPIQKARIHVQGPSPPAYSPLSPSSVGSSYDSSNGNGGNGNSNPVNGNGVHHVSPGLLTQPPPAQVSPPFKPVVTLKKVNVYRPAPSATTAAIPQGRTLLACVLFSVLFFWNPFIAVSHVPEGSGFVHNGHDHRVERVYDYGTLESSSSYGNGYHWLSSTYIIAGLIHALLFLWLVARLFILPEEMLSNGSEAIDIEADVKHHIRYAHDHIINGHYSVAFEELSTACAILGHPLPQTSLDAILSVIWATFRQLGHILRFGIAITIWTVQFLADGPLQPAVLHRRLTTCASIQQRIVKLAAAGKIDLPVCTRLALSLSSISLQETAYALATNGCSDGHWHHLLEDSYITAGIFIFHLPLPVCFLARYYFFQASATAKFFGSVGEHRRFSWLYDLDSSTVKDLVSMSVQAESAQDKTSQSVFFDNTSGGKRVHAINEPWSRLAWLRSRDLLTELMSCLTLSAPATLPTSIPKALHSRTIDSTIEYCLAELEQIENCLRGGMSTPSRLGTWLKLFRGCHAWRRANQEALTAVVDSIMKDQAKASDENTNPTINALQFALVSYSLLPTVDSRYQTIQRLLRATSALLESNLHEDPDDIVLQFCRLMAAEITLSCRLNLVTKGGDGFDKRGDLSQAESCMAIYIILLDRMAPNHPRALMYRSRVAIAAGENPIVAERFAKTALAITIDSNQSRGVRFASPNQSSINLLSAEAVLLLSLLSSKFSFNKSGNSVRDREALQQAVQSFQDENSPALAHLCNQLIGID